MKATFEFNLPEEREEYEIYARCFEFLRALHSMKEWLRRLRDQDGDTGLDRKTIDTVWVQFQDFINEEGIGEHV
jgi:hypothetical protein